MRRDDALDKLEIFIGKWINKGKIVGTDDEILTSDIYEWVPGKYFVLHTAYGRAGEQNGGGVEVIGYDATTGKYYSRFFDSRGNVRESELVFKDDHTCTWKAEDTGCTAEFSENGTIQTAHHIRMDDQGNWVPAMEVMLTKVV